MRNHIILLAFLAMMFTVAVPGTSHAIFGLFEHQYKVVFKDVPALADDNIYKDGEVIGNITEKKPTGEGVIVTIDVKKQFLPVMLDTTVFVAQDGKLMYATLAQNGSPLPEKANVLGFSDTLQLNLFRARLVMQDIGSILQKSADEIAKSLGTFK